MTAKKKSTSFAQRRKKASPAEATARVCLDMQLHRQYIDASVRLEQLKVGKQESRTLDAVPDAEIEALMREIVDLRERLDDASEPYVFRKLRNPDWRALVDEYPPTDEQIASAAARERPRPDVNYEMFWPEAIAACAVDPELTVADAVWLRDGDDDWSGLPDEKWDEIISTVQALHVSGVDVPKEWLAIEPTLRRGLSLITAAREESPSASSGDG